MIVIITSSAKKQTTKYTSAKFQKCFFQAYHTESLKTGGQTAQGDRGALTMYVVSVDRGVPPSLSRTGVYSYSIVQILGRGSNIPAGKGPLLVWTGVVKLPLRRI